MNKLSKLSAKPSSSSVNETICAGDETRSIREIQRAKHESEQEADFVLIPQVGDVVDHFHITAKLGAGVSCFVFRGEDVQTRQPVALKIVNWANVFDRDAAMQQLRIEATALARVKHPRVVQFIDFGIDPRWPYLVTEFIEGSPLGELIRNGGALPPAWCMHILSQMVEGLGAVWRASLVHRDIKPDNVLIDPEGNAKLIDFGLAKSPVLQSLNGQNGPELAGTASYLAPEQAKDASVVDHRADIYSLGVTLYEMLTGKLPFEGKNRMQMIFHHLNTQPNPPRELDAEIPELMSELCIWMLNKDLTQRPQSYDELRSALDAIL